MLRLSEGELISKTGLFFSLLDSDLTNWEGAAGWAIGIMKCQ